MSSPEQEMSSPEPLFSYSELRQFISQHLGKVPSKSTLNGWMEAVLDLPEPNPQNPREYPLSDAMALVLWGRAGEIAKRGERKTRAQRRNNLFHEAFEQWQLSQKSKSTSATPALTKVLAA
jgi:hypothetical protein